MSPSETPDTNAEGADLASFPPPHDLSAFPPPAGAGTAADASAPSPNLSELPPPAVPAPPAPPVYVPAAAIASEPEAPQPPKSRKGIIIAAAAVLTIAIAGGATALLWPSADDTAATQAAPVETSETPSSDAAPEPAPAPAPQVDAPKPAETGHHKPTGDPHTTGLCPTGSEERYFGTTTDFTVRICNSGGYSYTYVGGNQELGYQVLPAELSASTSGSSFVANNDGTKYAVLFDRLIVTPAGEESWDQVWHTGNMTELHPGE